MPMQGKALLQCWMLLHASMVVVLASLPDCKEVQQGAVQLKLAVEWKIGNKWVEALKISPEQRLNMANKVDLELRCIRKAQPEGGNEEDCCLDMVMGMAIFHKIPEGPAGLLYNIEAMRPFNAKDSKESNEIMEMMASDAAKTISGVAVAAEKYEKLLGFSTHSDRVARCMKGKECWGDDRLGDIKLHDFGGLYELDIVKVQGEKAVDSKGSE